MPHENGLLRHTPHDPFLPRHPIRLLIKDRAMTSDTNHTPEQILPGLLTIKQAAKHFQVSTKTIRRWVETGDLVAHRFGRQWRISDTDLHIFIRMRREV